MLIHFINDTIIYNIIKSVSKAKYTGLSNLPPPSSKKQTNLTDIWLNQQIIFYKTCSLQ